LVAALKPNFISLSGLAGRQHYISLQVPVLKYLHFNLNAYNCVLVAATPSAAPSVGSAKGNTGFWQEALLSHKPSCNLKQIVFKASVSFTNHCYKQ